MDEDDKCPEPCVAARIEETIRKAVDLLGRITAESREVRGMHHAFFNIAETNKDSEEGVEKQSMTKLDEIERRLEDCFEVIRNRAEMISELRTQLG